MEERQKAHRNIYDSCVGTLGWNGRMEMARTIIYDLFSPPPKLRVATKNMRNKSVFHKYYSTALLYLTIRQGKTMK